MDLTKILFIFVLTIGITNSLEDPLEGEEKTVNYAAIDSPFRSQKVNMIWNKARYLHEISVYYYFFPISYHSYLLVQIYQNFCLLSYRFKFSDTCLFYDFGRTTFSLKSEPDLTRGTSNLFD